MEEKRIVCIGTGEKLTNPESMQTENGRFYRYPTPGVMHLWGGDRTVQDELPLLGHEMVAAYDGGPKIQGYGLLVIGDTYTKIVKPPVESNMVVVLQSRGSAFETKIIPAVDRARAIEEEWKQYGALMIVGELPVPGELQKAREYRRTYALNRLNITIDKRKAGRKSLYSPVERAWAGEFGIILPETVDSMARVVVSQETVECPRCFQKIDYRAVVCRHCGTSFEMAVSEYIELKALEVATRPGATSELMPKRGPGRPRKEEQVTA